MKILTYFTRKFRQLLSHEIRTELLIERGMVVNLAIERMRPLLQFDIKAEQLALINRECTTCGISEELYNGESFIVSLTTYGKRLMDVYLTIESIMQGTCKPNHIILWLSEELKDADLPVSLQRQVSRGLEIEYVPDTKAYKKLVPALRKYPESCIVTIDDDMIFAPDMLENMIHYRKTDKDHILANRVHRMVLGENKRPISYLQWERCPKEDTISTLNFLTGGCGLLYPPHCLSDEVFNESVFMDICPLADDIWFNAMARLKGTKIRKIPTRDEFYWENSSVQDVALWNANGNSENCLNDIQLKAVFTKYNLYNSLYE